MNNQKEKVREHYRNLEIEPFEIIEKNFTHEEQRGFYKGNILKYTLRDKGQNQKDAVKIQVYAEKLQDLELKVKIDETQKQLERDNEICLLDETQKQLERDNEICLLKDLVDFLEESIQHRQAIIENIDEGHIKNTNQYFIVGMRTVLDKIEYLKEEYKNIENDWYDEFDDWGNPNND